MEEHAPQPQQHSVDYAEAELQRFFDEFEIDVDQSRMSPDEVDAFKDLKRRLVVAIQKDKVHVDDECRIVLTTKDGETLTFDEPDGAKLQQMDRVSAREGSDIAKAFRLLGAMTGTSAATFARMKIRDFKIAQAVLGFFNS